MLNDRLPCPRVNLTSPRLLLASPPFLRELLVVLLGVIPVDVPVPRRRRAVNGALAPLESAGRGLGGVPLDGHASVGAA